jgi:hypothetical protein
MTEKLGPIPIPNVSLSFVPSGERILSVLYGSLWRKNFELIFYIGFYQPYQACQ